MLSYAVNYKKKLNFFVLCSNGKLNETFRMKNFTNFLEQVL